VLSAAHELNGPGYAVMLGLGAGLLLVWRQKAELQFFSGFRWRVWPRRLSRPFPLAFLILTMLMFLGGVIYAPSNYDGLTYRIPRILHWLADGRWHWIHTVFPRVNARACGVEWVSAPLIALTRTDRLLFLINIVSFLLLPGLVYSVFTRLGVRRRVAWHWMWLVPTGYCFVIQAGGIGNDLFGAPFVLAALDFALRARSSRAPGDFYASLLAAALMTSAKTSDLPLLLPWAWAILPSGRLLFRRPLGTVAVGLISFGASFLPTAFLNAHYAHDWTGWKSEGTCVRSDPPLRLAINVPLAILQNLTPPIFPLAGAWNQAVKDSIPAGLSLRMHQTVVEPGAADFQLVEMQIEEDAGLGFGVSLLLILSVGAAIRRRGPHFLGWRVNSPEGLWQTGVRWLPVFSLLALLTQSEVAPLARILAPYYAVLMPVFLAGPAQAEVVTQRWWRTAAAGVFCLAGLLVITIPARPLFPALTVLARLQAAHPGSKSVARAATVYTVYHNRNTAFAPALSVLPAGVNILGLFTYDDPESSLWLPYGGRRIVHVCPNDTADYLRQEGIHNILIPPQKLQRWIDCAPEVWVRRLNGVVTRVIPLELRASEGPTDWWLVNLP
jgi:hypothetical protein